MSTRYVWAKYSIDSIVNIANRAEAVRGIEVTRDVLEWHENSTGERIPERVRYSKVVYDDLYVNSNGNIGGTGGTTYYSDEYDDGVGSGGITLGKSGYIQKGTSSYNRGLWYKIESGEWIDIIWASDFSNPSTLTNGCRRATVSQEKGSLTGYASSATDGAYPADGVSGNVCLSKRSPSFSLKVHQDQPVQRVFLSITDRERFRHFDKAAA